MRLNIYILQYMLELSVWEWILTKFWAASKLTNLRNDMKKKKK